MQFVKAFSSKGHGHVGRGEQTIDNLDFFKCKKYLKDVNTNRKVCILQQNRHIHFCELLS